MKWDELRRMKFSDEEIRQIDREAIEELIELSKLAQSELSQIERRDDHMVSTLRRFVEGLGGKLEVNAVFGDTRITLRDV